MLTKIKTTLHLVKAMMDTAEQSGVLGNIEKSASYQVLDSLVEILNNPNTPENWERLSKNALEVVEKLKNGV